MKKIFTLTIIFFAVVCHSQAVSPSIGFDIRGRDCGGGLGLCSANVMNESNKKIMVQMTGENKFILTILRSSLDVNEETSIAGKSFSAIQGDYPSTFTQEGDLEMSKAVVEELGLQAKYNLLKKGKYPMIIEDNVVKITLTLTAGPKN